MARLATDLLPDFTPAVIFDVGANIGQSTRSFLAAFPGAAIYAFEPVATTFDTLRANIGALDEVRVFNLALGRRAGTARMQNRKNWVSNRILQGSTLFGRGSGEAVTMTAGDAFCAEHRIERIDILKIDTEGHDLDVLVGFQAMLSAGHVGLVEVEVSMNRENAKHVPFEAVRAYLDPLGYALFHLSEQKMDLRFSGLPILRRSNAIFIFRRIGGTASPRPACTRPVTRLNSLRRRRARLMAHAEKPACRRRCACMRCSKVTIRSDTTMSNAS